MKVFVIVLALFCITVNAKNIEEIKGYGFGDRFGSTNPNVVDTREEYEVITYINRDYDSTIEFLEKKYGESKKVDYEAPVVGRYIVTNNVSIEIKKNEYGVTIIRYTYF
jgi:hypothetical protein